MRPETRRRRTLLRVALVLLAAVSAAGFGARAAQAADPIVQLTLDQTSIPNHGSVTMTMTVSSSLGYPSGSVSFVNAAVPGTPLATVAVTPTGAKSSIAISPSLTFSSPPTSYSLYAVYVPDTTAFFLGLGQAQSATQILTVASTPAKADTGVTLSTSSLDVDTTTPVTLTATVAELVPGGSIPTGTVSFTDITSGTTVPLGTRPLVGGSAQLVVSTFAAGAHSLVASYSGSDTDKASSSDPPLVLNSSPPADPRLTTTSLVTLLPPAIALGETVTIVATVAQSHSSSTTTPPGGQVTFSSTSDLGQDVILGHAVLGTVPDGSGLTPHPDQAVIQVGTWERAADYAITASYIGDIFFKGSASPPVTLSVLPPGTGTLIAYTGNLTFEFGHPADFSATVTDQSFAPLAGRVVTFTLGVQSCTAIVHDDGTVGCSLVVAHDPGAATLSISVPPDAQTEAAQRDVHLTVTRAGTSIVAGFDRGDATTMLSATLLDDLGVPIANASVTLNLGSSSCSATTDATGFATCAVATEDVPAATLSASYAGDVHYLPSDDARLVRLQVASHLVYNGDTTADYDDPAHLSATLLDENDDPVSGQSVLLTLGAQTCAGTTGTDGRASCDLVVDQPAGNYQAGASFASHGVYSSSATSAPFTVTREETSISLNAVPGAGTTTLVATLLEDGVAPIANRAVTLSLGGVSCTLPATTNASGVGSCVLPTPVGVPTAQATASFAGDLYYTDAAQTITVTLQVATHLDYTGATTVDYRDTAAFSATLVDAAGAPVPNGAPVTFTLGAQHCSAPTTDGVASCNLTIAQPSGAYVLTASFSGQGAYLATSAQSRFVVTHEESSVTVGVSGPILAADGITLTGTLSEDGATPIAGRTLTLTIDGQSCTGVTNAAGVATCSPAAEPALGPTTSRASFAGDTFYASANASAPALLYAGAPGGGSFVIGNRDAALGTVVTFWGSQWWKLNTLSRSSAPSSFKGFAAHPSSPACGTSWSTDPGNSTPPPDGPLPTYMAVIASSSSSKSGSTISGTTAAVVIVETNAGYDDNPGHAGTGTVVATVC